MTREERKTKLIKELAYFLANDQGGKSIVLQMECWRPANDRRPTLAKEWARLCQVSGIREYSSYEETLKHLEDLLK